MALRAVFLLGASLLLASCGSLLHHNPDEVHEVCHQQVRSMSLTSAELDPHLAHGDELGACEGLVEQELKGEHYVCHQGVMTMALKNGSDMHIHQSHGDTQGVCD